MISAIAIDDEPVALDILRIHAAKVPFIELTRMFSSARAALDYMASQPVELIFLDVNMPDISGLEFAALINPHIQIIFTTAHTIYAVAGFDLAVTDFLLKPINYDRFLKACTQAQTRRQTGQTIANTCSNNIFVKDGYNLVRIDLNKLLYIRAEDNYISLVEQHRQTLVRMTMQEILNSLPKKFLRVHKSYVINADHIQTLESRRIQINGIKIPVSRSFMDEVKKYLLK